MRGKICLCLVAALSLVLPQAVWAYDVPSQITVGLSTMAAPTLETTQTTLLVGKVEDGTLLETGEIESSTGFALSQTQYIVETGEDYDLFSSAYDAAKDMGTAFAAAYQDGHWTVAAATTDESAAEDLADEVSGSVALVSGVLLSGQDGAYALFLDGQSGLSAADEEATSLGTRSYRGVLSFLVSGGNILPVNTLSLEEYLYGAVPSEMPSTWEEEALKAQAVAARSYTLTRLTAHEGAGYELCDTTHCQVYLGYGQEEESTNQAVDDTKGQLALYHGAPINAVFCSSSGGATDSGKNVWGNEVPYLQAVPEVVDEGVESWSRTYTASEIAALLALKGYDVGVVEDVQITSVNPYGRVQELTVYGSSGEAVFTGEETRTLFSATSDGSLPSRMYTINDEAPIYTPPAQDEPQAQDSDQDMEWEIAMLPGIAARLAALTTEQTTTAGFSLALTNEADVVSAAEATFTFTGKGIGHGVGMSQYGANAMAKAGYTYEEILMHYYTGITVE